MKDNDFKTIACNIAAHWRSMNEEPKLGKLILVQFAGALNFDPIKDNDTALFKSYNCIPIDLTKYFISVGFVEKGVENVMDRIFVMCDYLCPTNWKSKIPIKNERFKDDFKAPFSSVFIKKWIYIDEIIDL